MILIQFFSSGLWRLTHVESLLVWTNIWILDINWTLRWWPHDTWSCQVFGSLSCDQHPQNLSCCQHGSCSAEQNLWPHKAPDFSPFLRLSIQIQTLDSEPHQRSWTCCSVHPSHAGSNREAGSECGTRFGDIDWFMKQFYGCSHICHVNGRSQINGVLSDPPGTTGKVQFWSCEGSGLLHVSCCSLIRFMFDSDVCFHGNAATTWDPCSNSPFSAAPPL